ncbi:MAG TPA: adenylate/guanylate cyclase domain-containing protein, partial [Stellaceae bacterium]|nr:adenylate/guanylate cyclase domain-containing protein [Stellaceae bacterium]
MLRTSDVDALIDWILNEGRESDDLEAILVGVSTRLVERGMPLCRVSLSMPTIDPAIAVIQHVWWRDEAVETSGLSVDFVGGDAFRHSPIRFLRENRRPGGRWKLDDPETLRRFPLFQELQARGVTEYALRITEFSEGRTALLGAGLAIATDRPGGFIEDEIEAALRLLPALAVVAYRIVLLSVATETLSAYLGPQTGARVLQGMIHRGDSRIISAALLLADLRGFTALVDTAQPEAVMTWLNEHFDGIGGAITERGGEILKFLGDGLLAVFPSAAGDPAAACAVAV